MSHDQKPTRVRVVSNAGTPAQRRRDDAGSAATMVVDQETDVAAPGSGSEPEMPRALPLFVAGAAFLITAAATGAAIAWFIQS